MKTFSEFLYIWPFYNFFKLILFQFFPELNTKCALKEECLQITMEVLKTNLEENLCPVLIGVLLNLTHLDNFNYKVYINSMYR